MTLSTYARDITLKSVSLKDLARYDVHCLQSKSPTALNHLEGVKVSSMRVSSNITIREKLRGFYE